MSHVFGGWWVFWYYRCVTPTLALESSWGRKHTGHKSVRTPACVTLRIDKTLESMRSHSLRTGNSTPTNANRATPPYSDWWGFGTTQALQTRRQEIANRLRNCLHLKQRCSILHLCINLCLLYGTGLSLQLVIRKRFYVRFLLLVQL